MESIIETIASGLGNLVATLASSGVLFVVFLVLWIALGVGIVLSQGSVDATWESIRQLPVIVQGIAWVLFLPVMAGMWIWETTWPFLLRAVLLIGLCGWSLLVMLPRASASS